MKQQTTLTDQLCWKPIKKYLILFGNFLFAPYLKLKLYKFIFTNYLRASKTESLTQVKFLNHVISQVGTYYNPNFYSNPSSLRKYLNAGFLMLQYPNQFSKYLITLSKFNIQTYLEIGTGFGGSFITTVEYLMRLNPSFKYAIGIDVESYRSMHIYATFNKKVKYIVMDSQSPQFKNYINNKPAFDLIFLDGIRSRKRDFEIVKAKAKMIAIHDILEDDLVDAWKIIKNSYSSEYTFLEFTDQYLKNSKFLGIGLSIRKDFDEMK